MWALSCRGWDLDRFRKIKKRPQLACLQISEKEPGSREAAHEVPGEREQSDGLISFHGGGWGAGVAGGDWRPLAKPERRSDGEDRCPLV